MKQLLLICAAGSLSGCTVTLAPHVPYLPMIRDRGQAEARVSTGLNGSELQVGYQVTDKLIVHTALLTNGRAPQSRKLRSADLGLGYYYSSPNGFWRLGVHGGLATCGGKSSSSGGFESVDPSPSVDYRLRYTYAYAQPTVQLVEDRQTWSFGLRMGRTYYHRFSELGADTLGVVTTTEYGGHQVSFMQSVFQYGYRASPSVSLSAAFGAQTLFGSGKHIGGVNPFVGQVGVHLTLKELPRLRR